MPPVQRYAHEQDERRRVAQALERAAAARLQAEADQREADEVEELQWNLARKDAADLRAHEIRLAGIRALGESGMLAQAGGGTLSAGHGELMALGGSRAVHLAAAAKASPSVGFRPRFRTDYERGPVIQLVDRSPVLKLAAGAVRMVADGARAVASGARGMFTKRSPLEAADPVVRPPAQQPATTPVQPVKGKAMATTAKVTDAELAGFVRAIAAAAAKMNAAATPTESAEAREHREFLARHKISPEREAELCAKYNYSSPLTTDPQAARMAAELRDLAAVGWDRVVGAR